MSFQDNVAAKLQNLQNVTQFIQDWVISTKSTEWLQVDADYAVAKAQYVKMRKRIIDLATALPTV